MSYQEAIAKDARLIILRELVLQVDGQLNEISLRRALDACGITRTQDWIVTQLHRLVELEAIKLREMGDILVAVITQAGRDHVSERSILGGVSRPHELGG